MHSFFSHAPASPHASRVFAPFEKPSKPMDLVILYHAWSQDVDWTETWFCGETHARRYAYAACLVALKLSSATKTRFMQEQQLRTFDKHELSMTKNVLEWLHGDAPFEEIDSYVLDHSVFHEDSFEDLELFD